MNTLARGLHMGGWAGDDMLGMAKRMASCNSNFGSATTTNF